MTAADWIIIAVILISTLLAAAEGFFYEAFSLSGTAVGMLTATWEYARLAPWFSGFVKSESVANACGFFTIFFAMLLLADAIARLARWAIRSAGLSWADRLLGAAFGFVRGIVMVTVTIMALAAFVPESQLLNRSELSRYFLLSARTAALIAPADLRSRVKQGVIALRSPATEPRTQSQ